jgi:hypothetical protein
VGVTFSTPSRAVYHHNHASTSHTSPLSLSLLSYYYLSTVRVRLQNATPPHGQQHATIFAANRRTPNGNTHPPDTPFALPTPPASSGGPLAARLSAQWYFFARYSLTNGAPCKPLDETAACCGLIREFAWPFALARGAGSTRELECVTRLASYPTLSPRNADFATRPHFWPRTQRLLAQCRMLQAEWRREANRTAA